MRHVIRYNAFEGCVVSFFLRRANCFSHPLSILDSWVKWRECKRGGEWYEGSVLLLSFCCCIGSWLDSDGCKYRVWLQYETFCMSIGDAKNRRHQVTVLTVQQWPTLKFSFTCMMVVLIPQTHEENGFSAPLGSLCLHWRELGRMIIESLDRACRYRWLNMRNGWDSIASTHYKAYSLSACSSKGV
jgi:hypothetical protein